VEKIIKKDMIDPTNGKKLIDTDLIPIQRVTCLISRKTIIIYIKINIPNSLYKGGTGYAGSGASLSSKKVGPAMIS
jgi:hypothetical protein